MRSKIIIYGGSSLISKYLFFEFYKDDCEFIVFCRDKKKVIQNIESLNLDLTRFHIHSINLEEVEKNQKIIDSFNFKIHGIIWVAGYTGNPEEEINNPELIKHNYNINLINPILIINYLLPRLSDNGFISVLTSTAGIRGRTKRIFYCLNLIPEKNFKKLNF